jgi:hypothetical protein
MDQQCPGSALQTLQTEVDQKRRLLSYQLRSRQEEEQVRALEFQAQQRLQALQHDITKAAGEAQMKDQVGRQCCGREAACLCFTLLAQE